MTIFALNFDGRNHNQVQFLLPLMYEEMIDEYIKGKSRLKNRIITF